MIEQVARMPRPAVRVLPDDAMAELNGMASA